MKNTVHLLALALIAVVICISAHSITKSIKVKSEKISLLKKQCEIIQHEKESLETIALSSIMDNESRKMLSERITSIEQVLVKRAANKKSSIEPELAEIIGNKKNFLSTLALLFAINHQNFIGYLKKNDLSDLEIGYCCLYSMGLTGKEVSYILDSTNGYNINLEIRKKLCIESSETLPKFIRCLASSIERSN